MSITNILMLPSIFYILLVYGFTKEGFIYPYNLSIVFFIVYCFSVFLCVKNKKIQLNINIILLLIFLLLFSLFNVPNLIYRLTNNAYIQMIIVNIQMIITLFILPYYINKLVKKSSKN
jgi:hypothetical protein